MRDRSLDEFATGDTADEEAEPDADADADVETDAADDSSKAAVEPALSTYDWTPGGAACGRCGETVEKRWRDGDGTGEALVCAECKEW